MGVNSFSALANLNSSKKNTLRIAKKMYNVIHICKTTYFDQLLLAERERMAKLKIKYTLVIAVVVLATEREKGRERVREG